MEVGLGSTLLAGDPRLVDHIVGEVKSQGIFDQFRKECIADVDTKPAYQNLRTRVESSVNTFLCKQTWKPDMNKNQLRENLRKQIHDAAYLDAGVERIVDQVVNPKVYSVFMPQIEDVVYKFLGIERPKDRERNGTKSLKDLLPKDLDPVSPESDKNSLKDVSLESVDANMAATSGKNDHSLAKDVNKVETNFQSDENVNDKLMTDNNSPNKQSENSESQLESNPKNSIKNVSASNLNISTKSDEKPEEEEEDSPMFEPIDIMNFNESNDSHLSGISELTSHRSRSPDFSNDFSRDNLDFSNHDSQLSKVSSDSRLSIVTDFGLSNHASTPMLDTLKEDNKGKSVESLEPKCNKDNFKEIRDIETSKLNTKEAKISFETMKSKENTQEPRDSKDLKSSKGTQDSTDSGGRDKNDSKDSKDSKDKYKDNDGSKTKLNKDKSDLKESKTHKERDKDYRKRQSSHSSSKHEKTDKYSKDKYKEKSEKCKEYLDKSKEAEKPREDKKDGDRKESATKDLKDIYKEKIRELREKKELTEKEKLAKDPKDSKSTKESRDKKDFSRDRKDSKSSSTKSSGRHDDKSNKNDEKSVHKNESKSSSKGSEFKESKNESKDKGKRDDKRQSKDGKESRSKGHSNSKNDSIDKSEKFETKKDNKTDGQSKESERSERSDTKRDTRSESQRSEAKKDLKTESQNKDYERTEKLDAKKDSKNDSQNKERKRKDEKKTKTKDDHSSLRKNPNDRRSTDRDGSNGSNSKNSQKSSSSSITNSSKSGSSSLTKETSGTSNSSSETSDNVDVSPCDGIKLPIESIHKDRESSNKIKPFTIKITNETENEPDYYIESDLTPKRVDLGQAELSLPLKKRPLHAEVAAPNPSDFKVKKPKFAKNFQEAKKLMKIRKKLEKQSLKEYEAAKEKFQMANDSSKPEPVSVTVTEKKTPTLPDDERVQIIEVTDDEYEEPYPDFSMKQLNISLKEQSLTSLENPLVFNPQDKLQSVGEKQSNLSAMEKSIRQSLQDMISDKKLLDSGTSAENASDTAASVKTLQSKASVTTAQDIATVPRSTISEKRDSIKNEETSQVGIQTVKSVDAQQNEAREFEKSTTCRGESNDNYSSSKMSTGSIIPLYSNKNTTKETISSRSNDNCNCLYFEADNERAVKFSKFLQSLELEVLENEICPQNSSESLEKILEGLGGQIVSSLPKTMAPPMPKRKHSTSPLTDILLNSTNNNNNNRHKMKESTPEEESNTTKKRKLGRPKKQQAVANVCAIQNLPNGENFVMPLSPESDVSASSEKNSLHLLKEDKSRQRSSQRYSSDDLYKPRPFFSSSSRRSRRSNQA